MKKQIVDIKGKKKSEIDLEDQVFAIEPNRSVIYESIKNELANKRQGTASVKTKAEVRATGAKPWKQKGTGRARAGVKTSPVWYHGGVAHGPKPRDYSYKLPRKVKNLAFRSLFSLKNKMDTLIVVEDFTVEGKTKEVKAVLDTLAKDSKVTMVLSDSKDDSLVKRGIKNLPKAKSMSFKRMNVKDLFYSDVVIITESVAKELNTFLLMQSKAV